MFQLAFYRRCMQLTLRAIVYIRKIECFLFSIVHVYYSTSCLILKKNGLPEILTESLKRN